MGKQNTPAAPPAHCGCETHLNKTDPSYRRSSLLLSSHLELLYVLPALLHRKLLVTDVLLPRLQQCALHSKQAVGAGRRAETEREW